MQEYETFEEAELAKEMAASKEIKAMLFDLLNERFKDELEFGPIVVLPRYNDRYDEAYLHAYIVFHGDYKKLDPRWTLRLSRRLWPRADALGFPGIPLHSFVGRSEWPAMEKWMRRHPDDFERYIDEATT